MGLCGFVWVCVAWHRSVAPGRMHIDREERRDVWKMDGEWRGEGRDRCQRAVVMPKLIHSAGLLLPQRETQSGK